MVSKQALLDFDLYPVTCQSLSRGRSNEEILEELIKGGARAVQLREKELPDGEFLRLARHFRQRTLETGMTFIVNDRVDVCLAVEADGVHLGQDDFPIPEARKLLGPDKIIGASTHSVEEALRAVAEGADYINIGPIFATQTKEHLSGAVGVELYPKVREAVQRQVSPGAKAPGYRVPKLPKGGSKQTCRQVPALDGEKNALLWRQTSSSDADISSAVKPRPALKDGATSIPKPPKGGSEIEDMAEHIHLNIDFPITVMGGINLSNIDQALRTGARRIAVVSAVVGAEDVAEAVKELRAKIMSYE